MTTREAIIHRPGAPATLGAPSHYTTLDLMRGIAALAVVLYHFSDRLGMPWLMVHGYLAVDFFFIMSGFVLAEAYGQRLLDGCITIRHFITLRAVRLLPLVIIGTVFAYTLEVWRPDVGRPTLHFWEALAALFLNCFLIPTPFSSTMHQTLFPLNNAIWSLFFEMIVNAILPVWIKLRYRGQWLALGMGVSTISMVYGAAAHGSIQLGFDWSNIYFGFPRVILSFGFGLLLHTYRHMIPKVEAWMPALALCCVLAVGPLGEYNAYYDCTSLLIILPLITALAIGSQGGQVIKRLSRIFGELSYPVYAVHAPVVRIVATLAASHHLGLLTKLALLPLSIGCIVGLSAIAYVRVDVPVRRFLTRRLNLSRSQSGGVT